MPVTHSAVAAETVPLAVEAVAPLAASSPPLDHPVVGCPLVPAPVADVLAPVSVAPSVDRHILILYL